MVVRFRCRACVKEAQLLLIRSEHYSKHVWGVAGGNQPVSVLKEKVNILHALTGCAKVKVQMFIRVPSFGINLLQV